MYRVVEGSNQLGSTFQMGVRFSPSWPTDYMTISISVRFSLWRSLARLVLSVTEPLEIKLREGDPLDSVMDASLVQQTDRIVRQVDQARIGDPSRNDYSRDRTGFPVVETVFHHLVNHVGRITVPLNSCIKGGQQRSLVRGDQCRNAILKNIVLTSRKQIGNLQ